MTFFGLLSAHEGFPHDASGKEPVCQIEPVSDAGSIPGSGRYPGEGHGNPFQYSYLENPMDRGPGHKNRNIHQWTRTEIQEINPYTHSQSIYNE